MKTETIIAVYFAWLAGLAGYTLGAHRAAPDWYLVVPLLPLAAVPVLNLIARILRRLHL